MKTMRTFGDTMPKSCPTTLYALLVLCVVGTSYWVHLQAGTTLPIPWNDESWTLFPARNLATQQQFHSPELNPDKVIFCYPLHDSFLALTWPLHRGKLHRVRDISWAWSMTAYVILAIWLFRQPFRFLLLSVVSLFFLSAPMVVTGNMVRPEAFMLAMCSGIILCAERNRPWHALGLAILLAVLHPAGMIPAAFTLPALLLVLHRERTGPTRGAIVFLGFGLFAAIFYAAIILWHWHDYLEWFSNTYSEPMTQNVSDIVSSRYVLRVVLPALILTFCCALFDRTLLLPCLLVFGIALIPAIRTQMWYAAYRSYSTALLLTLGGLLISRRIRNGPLRRFGSLGRLIAQSLLAALLLPFLHASYRHGLIDGPRGYPADMTWGWGMTLASSDTPYFHPEDRNRIAEGLHRWAGERPKRLLILPEGDFFLMPQGFSGFTYFQPVRTLLLPDLVLLHQSRYKPPWVHRAHLLRVAPPYRLAEIVHKRDDTEVWTLYILDNGSFEAGENPGPL